MSSLHQLVFMQLIVLLAYFMCLLLTTVIQATLGSVKLCLQELIFAGRTFGLDTSYACTGPSQLFPLLAMGICIP
ncbi:hypothetical protein AAHA92_16075 [Salvia divinorum]|uniref:Uncharacterized protein n=1 Tax=Salvia divinorum TaxID=28513 RepID=A0ABD1GUU8_SALDI